MTAAALFSRVLPRARRLAVAGALASLTLLGLSGCGGGVEVDGFGVSVVVNGRTVGTADQSHRGSVIYVPVNSAFELEASEPVRWTLYVGNTAVTGSGTVRYGDVEVTFSSVTSSRVAIDTYSRYYLSQSVPITMVATSTYDSAQVATAYIYITT